MKSEKLLISESQKGVAKAQRDLYDRYKSRWFMICLRYVKKREDALDVLQNSLVKIFSKLDTFDSDRGTFSNWSSRVVVNESIMFQRKFWRAHETIELHDENLLTTQESNPIENLGAEEITRLIQKLPDGYRVVFNMFAIEGFSHKEIAQILGITVGTSKSQLFKAKNMLKRQIEVII
ncbi:MAG: RNA polymerase sigma factor [Saprospiraceae bacterium]|nr:RNA polymerase sigma factor [Bacteroidia bacterium]NNE14074.1 RNA polymerase sigma factor [Saprospiraceae bacterium]NNL92298.1 RNA polymerase sigma factor [Saprospiraceae bacterium]